MPPPHFCLKVVCKRGGGTFSGAYGNTNTYHQVFVVDIFLQFSDVFSDIIKWIVCLHAMHNRDHADNVTTIDCYQVPMLHMTMLKDACTCS